MSAPVKLNQVAGYMCAIQAAHGTAETLAGADDGIFPYLGDGLPDPPTALDYIYDGKIGRDVRYLAPTRRVSPNGRGRKQDFKALFRGAGEAYASSAVLPPNEVHVMLQLAGFTPTFSTDKWIYTTTAPGNTYKVGTVGTYAHNEAHVMYDAIADWSFTFDDLGVPVHSFTLEGIGNLPTTLSLPSITYQHEDVNPPVAAGMSFVIGDWITPIVKGGSFKLNRNLGSQRARVSAASGRLGNVPGGHAPQFTFMVEKTAFVNSPYHTSAGLSPEALREAAIVIPVSVQWGTANNRVKVELGDAQVSDVKPANDEAVAMWEITVDGILADAITVTLD